ncbi:MAG: acyl-CoA dehydrogenase family protein [Candidatus Rokubacteria bacterium]|nr:acyl-CoA dehydrogenase family protein [Candidatus Rokubacteria bacterium]
MSTLLGDVVTRLFTDRVSKELIESAEKGAWPAALWREIEEGGLTMPLVPEARGGAGGTWLDAYAVIHAAGRHAVPLPVAETILAGWLLSRAGLDVPEGPLTIAPVHLDERVRLTPVGSRWRLDGTATRVPWGRDAGHVVVVAPSDAGTVIGLVAGNGATVITDRNLALEPRDTLTWSDAEAVAAATDLPADVAWRYGALVRAAQMAGGLESLLAQSVRYATERKQFGKAIGSFQVIQQNLALLAGHTAAAGMAAAHAFRCAERGDAWFDIAVAKTRVGEAAGLGAGIAHQTHGAIGFTYEHSLHFTTRRLWSWRAEFGGEGWWAAELGRSVARDGAEALWPKLTAR